MRGVPFPRRRSMVGAMIDFGGNRVVITGAAGGVGRALVETFASCGAAVVACDLPEADFTGLPVAEAHEFDLLDSPAMERSVAAIVSGGAPAAVVSNAGWTRAETLDDVTPEALSHELDLNLRSAAALSQAFLPSMRDRPDGAAFVFVSTINALSHFGNPAYAAAKAGLLAWMRAIATEQGASGVRANAVVPGSIRTAAWDWRVERDPRIIEKVSRFYPLGRLVEPVEVARTAAFLASPAASGITGAAVPVDGGMTAGNLHFIEQISG